MKAATIKLFLASGAPTGLRTAEISNWSGKAVAAPRTEFDSLLQRDELTGAGVYLLVGNNPNNDKVALYVGEAESVVKRIKSHKAKDFWVSAVAFVSKDENLTKAHVRYLEGRLILLAQRANVELQNSVSSGARLPESDAAEMEVFLEKVLQLMPVLGFPNLRRSEQADNPRASVLICEIKGSKARGARTDTGFVVYEGSQAVADDRPSATFSVERRQQLLEEGVLIREDSHFVFTQDYEFTSPSAAASIIHGGHANGLTAWKNTDGKSLKDIEA